MFSGSIADTATKRKLSKLCTLQQILKDKKVNCFVAYT